MYRFNSQSERKLKRYLNRCATRLIKNLSHKTEVRPFRFFLSYCIEHVNESKKNWFARKAPNLKTDAPGTFSFRFEVATRSSR